MSSVLYLGPRLFGRVSQSMSCGYSTELGGTSKTFPLVQHTLELGTGMHDQESVSDGSGTDKHPAGEYMEV
jgi:hypothetical protein